MTEHEGRPSLKFRVANGRGNEVVEATVRVVMLRSETTVEGHSMRRLYDLPLRRHQTPLFLMSWLVVHVIDENSPLHGLSPEDFDRDEIGIVVSLTGLDGTFSQTVYGGHLYGPDDVLWGHQFADILSRLDDGRLLFDYDKFHHTIPPRPRLEPDRR